jgi:hypothetical protein
MEKYSSISLPRSVSKRVRDMHKAYQPRMLLSGFVQELLDVYNETHCPECNSALNIKAEPCSCRQPIKGV